MINLINDFFLAFYAFRFSPTINRCDFYYSLYIFYTVIYDVIDSQRLWGFVAHEMNTFAWNVNLHVWKQNGTQGFFLSESPNSASIWVRFLVSRDNKRRNTENKRIIYFQCHDWSNEHFVAFSLSHFRDFLWTFCVLIAFEY